MIESVGGAEIEVAVEHVFGARCWQVVVVGAILALEVVIGEGHFAIEQQVAQQIRDRREPATLWTNPGTEPAPTTSTARETLHETDVSWVARHPAREGGT